MMGWSAGHCALNQIQGVGLVAAFKKPPCDVPKTPTFLPPLPNLPKKPRPLFDQPPALIRTKNNPVILLTPERTKFPPQKPPFLTRKKPILTKKNPNLTKRPPIHYPPPPPVSSRKTSRTLPNHPTVWTTLLDPAPIHN